MLRLEVSFPMLLWRRCRSQQFISAPCRATEPRSKQLGPRCHCSAGWATLPGDSDLCCALKSLLAPSVPLLAELRPLSRVGVPSPSPSQFQMLAGRLATPLGRFPLPQCPCPDSPRYTHQIWWKYVQTSPRVSITDEQTGSQYY